MEVIRINNVTYRVDEQALQGRPAHCHRAAPIRGRVFTLCKTAPIIIHQLQGALNQTFAPKWGEIHTCYGA